MAYKRHFRDWLRAFVDYASYGEAPRHMYFWAGVSAVAGALRRKVWIDQAFFKWTPNFYIILVAPPGIVSKSTTASVAMDLLRSVPGINFGPDVVTWPALVQAFAEKTESFEWAGAFYPMSAITIESSEFGNLLNPQDKEMVDLLVSLWDGKQGKFEKRTKSSGNDSIENPWINVIACTTPSWIAGSFPEYMIGGGFTSRCVFVYAEKKEKYVAYPGRVVPADMLSTRAKLIDDLTHIGTTLAGPYTLEPDALNWGETWYYRHYEQRPANLDDDRFGGYIARKQTHLHKLAMVLAAAQRDELVITREDLETANIMVTNLESTMPLVFNKIGRSDASVHTERLLGYVKKYGRVKYSDAYRFVHANFPAFREFEDVVTGLIRSNQVALVQQDGEYWLKAN